MTKAPDDVSEEEIARQRLRKSMAAAGVKPLYGKMRLPDLGKPGIELRKYLQDGRYAEDVSSNIGVHIYGNGKDRLNALPVMAKEMILLGEGVRLYALRELVNMIMGDDYDDAIDRAPALCITFFQVDGVECPYTFMERSHIEQFLIDRAERGKRNYLSASTRLQDCQWWSIDFREFMGQYIREFKF